MFSNGEFATPIIGFVNFRCAVDEMGRNSVMPSTTARIIAWIIVMGSELAFWFVA